MLGDARKEADFNRMLEAHEALTQAFRIAPPEHRPQLSMDFLECFAGVATTRLEIGKVVLAAYYEMQEIPDLEERQDFAVVAVQNLWRTLNHGLLN